MRSTASASERLSGCVRVRQIPNSRACRTAACNSYILEGQFGFEIGDREFEAGAGSLVFKPRDVRHGFWNLGLGRGLILEIVSPAGLEGFFEAPLALFEGGALPG